MKRVSVWIVAGLALVIAGAGSAIVRAQQAPAAASARVRRAATDQVPVGADGAGDESSGAALAKRVADLEAARAQQRKWIETLASDLKSVHTQLDSLKTQVKP